MKLGWGWVVVVSSVMACGDDVGGRGAGATADSGSVPGEDASGGADADGGDGGGGGGSADASAGERVDGAIADASPADAAAPGVVTVTVEWAPHPPDQATVFFLRADDSVVDIVSTDADGRAEAMYEEPGTVVILHGTGAPSSPQRLVAYLHVYPGTDIYSGRPTADRSGSVAVSGPGTDGAVGYMVETACGIGASLTQPVTAGLAGCRAQTHVIWVVRAMIEGQLRILSAFRPSAPVQEGGAASVSGPLRPDRIQTTRVSGLPEVEYAEMSYRVYSPHGVAQDGPTHEFLAPDDGSLDIADAFHDLRGLGLVGRVLTSVVRPGGASTDLAAWVEHDGDPDVDLAAVRPAALQGSAFDRATATWTWTEGSPGLVTAARGWVLIEEEGQLPFLWQVLAPDDGTPLRIPRLPPPFQRFNVGADSAATGAEVELFGHTRGYASLLASIDVLVNDIGRQPGDVVTLTYGAGAVIE